MKDDEGDGRVTKCMDGGAIFQIALSMMDLTMASTSCGLLPKSAFGKNCERTMGRIPTIQTCPSWTYTLILHGIQRPILGSALRNSLAYFALQNSTILYGSRLIPF